MDLFIRPSWLKQHVGWSFIITYWDIYKWFRIEISYMMIMTWYVVIAFFMLHVILTELMTEPSNSICTCIFSLTILIRDHIVRCINHNCNATVQVIRLFSFAYVKCQNIFFGMTFNNINKCYQIVSNQVG